MIQVEPLIAILTVEVGLGLILLIVFLSLRTARKTGNDQTAATTLINELEESEETRNQELINLISKNCDIEDDRFEAAIKEISRHESLFYQHILKMFLNHDAELLTEIRFFVHSLSQPYCKLLSETKAPTKNDPELESSFDKAKAEISRLISENKRFSQQLRVALETMDEVSGEYSNLFGGEKGESALETSRQRMLMIFQQAEQKNQAALSNEVGTTDDSRIELEDTIVSKRHP